MVEKEEGGGWQVVGGGCMWIIISSRQIEESISILNSFPPNREIEVKAGQKPKAKCSRAQGSRLAEEQPSGWTFITVAKREGEGREDDELVHSLMINF